MSGKTKCCACAKTTLPLGDAVGLSMCSKCNEELLRRRRKRSDYLRNEQPIQGMIVVTILVIWVSWFVTSLDEMATFNNSHEDKATFVDALMTDLTREGE